MFVVLLIPGLFILVLLANGFMLREIRRSIPNASRQVQIHELSKAWNSAGLSLARLPKPEKPEKEPKPPSLWDFEIDEEDTPT